MREDERVVTIGGGEGGPGVGSSLVSPQDAVTAPGSGPSVPSSPSRPAEGSHGTLQLDPVVPGLLWMTGEVDLDVVGATPAQQQAHEDLVRGVDVVDASQVTFIDSTGVHLLIVAATAARRRGSTLRLRRPADLVLALVQVMGLYDLFDVDTATC